MDGLSRPASVAPDDLTRLTSRILVAAGAPEEVSSIVARSLTSAESRGQPSHGVSRLPTYLRRIQAGLIRPAADLVTRSESGAVLTLDAGAGFGHAAGWRAMGMCIERAAREGIGAAAVRNSTHFGTAGFFAARAAEAGMIGIATSNGAALMAPPGTKSRVLGTNPVAVAIPSSGDPIVLDMATSTAALGKILVARDAGDTIPADWAIDHDGMPTTDPAIAAGGLLQPFGGHKGFGLAIVLEVLSAALSGAAIGPEAGSMYRTWDRPENLGHFFMAVNPAAFGDASAFVSGVDRLSSAIHGASPVGGGGPALLPGEPEATLERRAQAEGIRLTEALVANLSESASLVGLELPWR